MKSSTAPESTIDHTQTSQEREPMVHDGVFNPRDVIAYCQEVRRQIAIAQAAHVDVPV